MTELEPPTIDKTNNYYISRALFADYKRMFKAQGAAEERASLKAELEKLLPRLEELAMIGYTKTIETLIKKLGES